MSDFTNDRFRIDGKVAIVTGAGGRGNSIGRAYATGLANAGATLQTVSGLAVPSSISVVLQGAILIFLLAGEIFLRYRVGLARRLPAKAIQEQS